MGNVWATLTGALEMARESRPAILIPSNRIVYAHQVLTCALALGVADNDKDAYAVIMDAWFHVQSEITRRSRISERADDLLKGLTNEQLLDELKHRMK